MPIIVSTETTIAAFVPLGGWPGMIGEFMIYFPITLSAILGSSLIVAIFFNSMLVSSFMDLCEKEISRRNLIRMTYILGGFALVFVIFKDTRAIWSLLIFICGLFWLNTFLVKLENLYDRFLKYALSGIKPYLFLGGTVLMLFFSLLLFNIFPPIVEFFPDNEPRQILVYVEYPEGTDINKTNSTSILIEDEIYKVVNDDKYLDSGYNFMIESSIAQVGEGAGNPQTAAWGTGEIPDKALITLTAREFKYRRGLSSEDLRKEIQVQLLEKFPGIALSVEKIQEGPPTGYPVNIELYGEDYGELVESAISMRNFLNEENIEGIEQLKINVTKSKPGIEFLVDREKAGELGIPTGLVGQTLRTSIIGTKAGIYKEKGEDYDINVRFSEEYKNDINALINQNIVFRDQSNGKIKEIPIASVVDKKNTTSFNAIKHIDLERVVTLYSSILAGSNAQQVVNNIIIALTGYETSEGVNYRFTGEIKEQAENQSFLSRALITSLCFIVLLFIDFEITFRSKINTFINCLLQLIFIYLELFICNTQWHRTQ